MTYLHVAMNEDTLIIAVENLIYVADPELSIQKVLAGYFYPISMSLDEQGNIYLLARSPEPISTLILMGTTADGILFCTRQLSGRADKGTPPPVIGFDHTLYLLLHDRIQAFTMHGAPLWEGHAGGPIAGGVVTPDGNLLVGGGAILSAFDEGGQRTILRVFDGEAICSQPLPCLDGSLHVATEEYLYRLTPRKM
jgi:hypothetical protein